MDCFRESNLKLFLSVFEDMVVYSSDPNKFCFKDYGPAPICKNLELRQNCHVCLHTTEYFDYLYQKYTDFEPNIFQLVNPRATHTIDKIKSTIGPVILSDNTTYTINFGFYEEDHGIIFVVLQSKVYVINTYGGIDKLFVRLHHIDTANMLLLNLYNNVDFTKNFTLLTGITPNEDGEYSYQYALVHEYGIYIPFTSKFLQCEIEQIITKLQNDDKKYMEKYLQILKNTVL